MPAPSAAMANGDPLRIKQTLVSTRSDVDLSHIIRAYTWYSKFHVNRIDPAN